MQPLLGISLVLYMQVYEQLSASNSVPRSELYAATSAAGVDASTVDKVLAVVRVPAEHPVNVSDVLLLLLTLSCDSFKSVLTGIFEVFGGGISASIQAPLFQHIIGFLSIRDRDNVPTQVCVYFTHCACHFAYGCKCQPVPVISNVLP